MITKTELEEILGRVESGTTTGVDADKLRAYIAALKLESIEKREAMLDRFEIAGKIAPPETEKDEIRIGLEAIKNLTGL